MLKEGGLVAVGCQPLQIGKRIIGEVAPLACPDKDVTQAGEDVIERIACYRDSERRLSQREPQ